MQNIYIGTLIHNCQFADRGPTKPGLKNVRKSQRQGEEILEEHEDRNIISEVTSIVLLS